MTAALQGRRIAVTRPAAQAATLAALIGEHGGVALMTPLLDIGPVADPAPLRRAIEQLDDYALAIFVSVNAAVCSLPLLLARGWPAGLRPAAIGESTTAALVAAGVAPCAEAVIAPRERFDSEALLERPELAAATVRGRHVLIVRGNGGRELLAETLRERGARVDCVAAYERRPAAGAAALVSLLRNKGVDALTVSSSEGLRNLFAMLDTEACVFLQKTPVFVPHQRIAAIAAGFGLRKVILTAPADAGIMKGLCQYNWFSND